MKKGVSLTFEAPLSERVCIESPEHGTTGKHRPKHVESASCCARPANDRETVRELALPHLGIAQSQPDVTQSTQMNHKSSAQIKGPFTAQVQQNTHANASQV